MNIKALIVIRTFFFYQFITYIIIITSLYDFLKRSLAIIKELFVFNIV